MVVQTFRTKDQEYLQEFEVSLGYKVSTCLKNKQNYEGLLVCVLYRKEVLRKAKLTFKATETRPGELLAGWRPMGFL